MSFKGLEQEEDHSWYGKTLVKTPTILLERKVLFWTELTDYGRSVYLAVQG